MYWKITIILLIKNHPLFKSGSLVLWYITINNYQLISIFIFILKKNCLCVCVCLYVSVYMLDIWHLWKPKTMCISQFSISSLWELNSSPQVCRVFPFTESSHLPIIFNHLGFLFVCLFGWLVGWFGLVCWYCYQAGLCAVTKSCHLSELQDW